MHCIYIYLSYLSGGYFEYILRKENLHVHIEERSSSVWRVRGQVPRKHTCVCSFCRPHSLVFLVRLRHCNKSKQIPCIISRPAVTDSKRRRVILHSVHQSCCMNIHIHIYMCMQSLYQGFTVSQGLAHEL